MESSINQRPAKEEIQVYHNSFYSGIIRLTKKLFML